MSFRHHLALFSLLLKGDQDAASELLRNGAAISDDFIRFIQLHQLQLSLFYLLDASPIKRGFPSAWLQQLKEFALTRWIRQERLVHELARLSARLGAAGQEFILLKGPYLAARFFGAIDRREFRDLDILIKREKLPEIESVLREHGYTRRSNVLLNQALTTRFTHAFDFGKADLTVDLHWLLSANAAHTLDYETIWRERQTFLLGNQQFHVLSDEYEVVFNLISIFKDLERGAARLRQFVDLYFILSSISDRLDWEAFLEHRKREKILRVTVNVLKLFFDFFDCQDRFPEVFSALLREQRLVRVVSPESRQSLIEAPLAALGNKLWAAGLYECSRLHVFLWWLLSLPFRLAVHEPGKYGLFKGRLSARTLWPSEYQDSA